jgi:Ser/Thr protein kinase RdoA (MazF antagonist)
MKMPTEQGALLTRIASANRRMIEAEAGLEEAKDALKRTRQASELDKAKAERKAASLQLLDALNETLQLELPGTSDEAIWGDVARQVNAGALGPNVTATVRSAA